MYYDNMYIVYTRTLGTITIYLLQLKKLIINKRKRTLIFIFIHNLNLQSIREISWDREFEDFEEIENMPVLVQTKRSKLT